MSNALANLAGRGWSMLLGALCIPLYLRFVGVEAFGLIGFFGVLQGVAGLLDLGLGSTVTRELARASATSRANVDARRLVRSLEAVYWGLAVLAGAVIVAAAPLMATRWFHLDRVSPSEVGRALTYMGLALTMQFPLAFYQGGLIGVQRQVPMNVVLAAGGTLRSVGGALVLWMIPSVAAFFAWQIAVNAVQTLAMAVLLWVHIGGAPWKERFDLAVLMEVKGYAAAVSANAVVGVALTQLDKLLISKLVSLSDFGYYSLASTVSGLLWVAIIPINQALFPRFAQAIEERDVPQLARTYHVASQAMVAALVPVALTVICFAREALLIWTGDPATAARAAPLLQLLMLGTLLNGLASVPGYLQFAAGWPQLTLTTNTIAAVMLVPALLIVVPAYGALGAAAVWVVLNTMYLTITVPWMHRRILTGERRAWYVWDIFVPSVGAAAVVLSTRLIVATPGSRLVTMLLMTLTAGVAAAICVILATRLHQSIRAFFTGRICAHA